MARDIFADTTTLTILSGDLSSDSFSVPKHTTYMGIYFPPGESHAANWYLLVYSEDNAAESLLVPLIDPADGADYVVFASGSTPGYADVSTILGSVPSDWYLHLSGDARQHKLRNPVVCFRGSD
jgi:hypothetical protein